MALTLEEVHSDDNKRVRKPPLVKKKELQPWESFKESSTETEQLNSQEVSNHTLESERPKTTSLVKETKRKSLISTQLVHNKNTISTQKNKKSHTNKAQTSTQLAHNKYTIGTHPHKNPLDSTQLVHNKHTIGTQLEHQLVHEQVHNNHSIGTQEKQPISTQLVQNKYTISTHTSSYDLLMELSGFQQELAFYIISNCISKGALHTSHIGSSFLKNIASNKSYSSSSIKTSIQRLKEKNIMTNTGGKRGRGGYYVFSITEHIRNAYLAINKDTIGTQLVHNSTLIGHQQERQLVHDIEHNWHTNKDTKASSSSSSSYNYKENTTNNENLLSPNQQNIFELPNEWMSINCERLKDFGFGMPQLKQLFKLDKYSADDIQMYI